MLYIENAHVGQPPRLSAERSEAVLHYPTQEGAGEGTRTYVILDEENVRAHSTTRR